MKNYERVLDLEVFTFQDLNNIVNNVNTTQTIISSMLEKKYIKKVKYNLYVVCDIQFKAVIPDQYRIASKIKEDAFIGYHTALEHYGVKNQVFYNVYVLTDKPFEEFEFEGITYTAIKNHYNFGIETKGKVRRTDKERTIIDCINKTGLAGGNEELLICLELMQKVDGDKVLEYLKQYNSKKLYAKVGFMLQLLQSRLGIGDAVIEECKKHLSKTKYYFDDETTRYPNKYIKEWKLIVPEIFLTRGGTLHW